MDTFLQISIVSVLVSYLFGIYFGSQESKDKISKPLFWDHEGIATFLAIALSLVPLIVAVYFGFKAKGLGYVLAILFVRFVALPSLFNDGLLKLFKKIGI